MADTAKADAAAEAAKMDLLEDDDEFEEFEIDQGMHRFVPLLFCFCFSVPLVIRTPWLTLSCINFGVSEWDDKEEGNEAVQQWEDDWDDDDVSDDFSLQLRKELESNPSKN
ncbi:hypothetical protein ABZP36_015361 [Zizania latifolia]